MTETDSERNARTTDLLAGPATDFLTDHATDRATNGRTQGTTRCKTQELSNHHATIW